MLDKLLEKNIELEADNNLLRQKLKLLEKRNIKEVINFNNRFIKSNDEYAKLNKDVLEWEQKFKNMLTIISSIKRLSTADTIKELCDTIQYIETPKYRLANIDENTAFNTAVNTDENITLNFADIIYEFIDTSIFFDELDVGDINVDESAGTLVYRGEPNEHLRPLRLEPLRLEPTTPEPRTPEPRTPQIRTPQSRIPSITQSMTFEPRTPEPRSPIDVHTYIFTLVPMGNFKCRYCNCRFLENDQLLTHLNSDHFEDYLGFLEINDTLKYICNSVIQDHLDANNDLDL